MKDIFSPQGVIANPQAVANEIKELLKKPNWGKIRAERVNLSLPEEKIFSRVLELPQMSEAELSDAVQWEAEQYIPTPLKELSLDYEIVGTRSNGKEILNEVLMIAAPQNIINSYLEVIDKLGLEPYNIETNIQAVARSMISSKAKDEAILVIDIGGKTTSMAVFDKTVRITGSIPVGGENISVESKKASFPEIDTLASELKKLINYYEEKDDKKIARAFLCGGSACLPSLKEEIAQKINLEVEIGNPWVNISTYPLKPIPKAESPRYANAIGLALNGVLK